VTKRALATLAFAIGCVIGAAAGYGWHAPGRPQTWDDIRTWFAFVAVIVGVPVAIYQLSLQRRQLAGQQAVLEGEVQRNVRRDQLLDGQLRELEQRSLVAERAQAEAVSFELTDSAGEVSVYMVNVTNSSSRPIRNIVCRVLSGGGGPAQAADSYGQLVDWAPGGEVLQRVVVHGEEGSCLPLLRPGLIFAFTFGIGRADCPDATAVARFTDDAGLHWELGHDLHLVKIEDRSDW
jgi:hypothetical protein